MNLTGEDTLSRGNPIAEFLRHQKVNMKDMTQEEFMAKYESYMKEKEGAKKKDQGEEKESSRPISSHKDRESAEHKQRNSFHASDGNFKNIVLKFTTLSEGCYEAPSFTVDKKGAKIGREKSNDICVPSDQRLAAEGHATIEYHRGSFYILDGGHSFSASVRIGIGNSHSKKWILDPSVRFSAGNSVFESKGVNSDGLQEVFVVEGPMKGDLLKVDKKGATFGRSSENTISVPDRELSRRHSRIDFDEKLGKFTVNDMGSTNGTYVQLVGPYGGKYKLSLNDHILVGRTGFSINRFDYGLSEEMGYRQSMEDACSIVQHLNIGPLCISDLSPQSFFGVFDGHGGTCASHYLAQHLHVNVAHGILAVANDIFQILEEAPPGSICDESADAVHLLDKIVIDTLKSTFLKTDSDFLSTSPHPQHGSTATTALVLGRRLYCANVGDSRTLICRYFLCFSLLWNNFAHGVRFFCRNFEPLLMSQDHKPTREDEAKRIRDAGGFVINNRVMGELAVSRAFGDVDFKKGIQVGDCTQSTVLLLLIEFTCEFCAEYNRRGGWQHPAAQQQRRRAEQLGPAADRGGAGHPGGEHLGPRPVPAAGLRRAVRRVLPRGGGGLRARQHAEARRHAAVLSGMRCKVFDLPALCDGLMFSRCRT